MNAGSLVDMIVVLSAADKTLDEIDTLIASGLRNMPVSYLADAHREAGKILQDDGEHRRHAQRLESVENVGLRGGKSVLRHMAAEGNKEAADTHGFWD